MAAAITINDLEDGQEIYLPFEISGFAAVTVVTNEMVNIVAWQIDDGEIHELTTDPVTPAESVSFTFGIGAGDCPTPDTWYLLTIYAWDSNGVVSTESRTFKRLEMTTIPSEVETIVLGP